ncbi:hypothetical protein BFJ72_g3390 [Fusarium proliferatum]|uniref:Uncharacterized protein n=1 Tax=Gibberella intermedia TaxID=948311 RepID=A0A420TWI6_GIBIN|nr:hypothetical protein BFJ72_g3390 [Fusarium proliferatum]
MASKTNAECLLNTTECMLQTVASILNGIQEQNSEYNWDPLTFIFTAIIGVIAIAFAALTAFQAFLTAGPGRTKSGAYAIGPWSRHNYRRFDRSEMRFRTISSTPVLTVESLLEGSSESSIRSHEESGVLRKHQEDYFPATWLALLTHLSLDYPEIWKQVKLTGADFIPSEFSAVPAYGSIRFVATLALILSRGFGRLTLDRESGLLRVRHTWFHLIFRQHPLMGTIGFFEIYGKVRSEQLISRREIRRQFFQAHGQMEIPGVDPREDQDNLLIEAGQLLTFNEMGDIMFNEGFTKSVQQKCLHRKEEPNPACLNFLDYLGRSHYDFYRQGPLFLLIADIPDDSFLPIIFPHKKARLRERLDTLLLQSRSWGLQSLALCDIFPYPLTNVANNSLHVTDTANSWAKSTIRPDIHELELNNGVYEASLLCLNESTTKDIVYKLSPETRSIVLKELKTIDSWLKQIESQVLCRKLTLSIVGDGIRQIVESVQQQAISEAASHAKNATVLSNRYGLVGKLTCFLQAVKNPGCFNCLYSAGRAYRTNPPEEVIRSTSEGLEKIWDLWRIIKTPLEDDGDGSEVGAHGGEEYKCHAWKIPDETDHPLDGVLIYRAVLVTILYSLVCDSSALISEDLSLIVPIM